MNEGSDSIGCLVLAAGEGRRFGGPKQLAALAGRPMLDHVLEAAAGARAGRVVVVLGARAGEILSRVDLCGAEPVICKEWRSGMSEPLKAGVAELAEAEAIVVLLGDQPLVSAEAVKRLIAARRRDRDAVRATYGGEPGHPVVLERSLFERIADLQGDAGARVLLERTEVVAVPCDDVADPLDVDSPADLRLAESRLKPSARADEPGSPSSSARAGRSRRRRREAT